MEGADALGGGQPARKRAHVRAALPANGDPLVQHLGPTSDQRRGTDTVRLRNFNPPVWSP